MADLKTKLTDQSVDAFLNTIENEQKRKDSIEVAAIMSEVTKAPAKMWGPAIIGFGDYHYKYESGRENDWFIVGFSPRKANITLYIPSGFDKYDGIMEKLGKYKKSKACIYINAIADIDKKVLKTLVKESIVYVKNREKLQNT